MPMSDMRGSIVNTLMFIIPLKKLILCIPSEIKGLIKHPQKRRLKCKKCDY